MVVIICDIYFEKHILNNMGNNYLPLIAKSYILWLLPLVGLIIAKLAAATANNICNKQILLSVECWPLFICDDNLFIPFDTRSGIYLICKPL